MFTGTIECNGEDYEYDIAKTSMKPYWVDAFAEARDFGGLSATKKREEMAKKWIRARRAWRIMLKLGLEQEFADSDADESHAWLLETWDAVIEDKAACLPVSKEREEEDEKSLEASAPGHLTMEFVSHISVLSAFVCMFMMSQVELRATKTVGTSIGLLEKFVQFALDMVENSNISVSFNNHTELMHTSVIIDRIPSFNRSF